jgi:NADH dehydrogenase [ubiquinone] 1 alpha subcomplex assembly factor 5
VTGQLFDISLRAMRRDRACRQGPELFLHERAFDDVIERLSLVRRAFSSALLIGCPDPAWKDRLLQFADRVDVADPGPLFAQGAGGRCVVEEEMNLDVGAYDICVAVGTFDTVNGLPQTLLRVRLALGPDALLIGAMAGGDSLPRLRAAMRAADEQVGAASAHVHPRIEPAALGGLLAAAGFVSPVVDVDRVDVSYACLSDLVRDLRRMAASNLLCSRSKRPLPRKAAAAAAAFFAPGPGETKAVERFDILHFAAWTPPQGPAAQG